MNLTKAFPVCLTSLLVLAGACYLSAKAGDTKTVTIAGGHETSPVDHGRPVKLVASALGVPEQVFRDAFTHVHPSRSGPPTPEEARANKHELLSRLEPYGVTNERLDQVSNYYRYRPQNGKLWKHVDATAEATVTNGVVTGVKLTNPGAGYLTAPEFSIPGMPDVKLTAKVNFTKDLATNGSLSDLKLK